MALAGVFPGQGSQSLGMLASLADGYAEIRDTFQEASDVLNSDLWSLAQNGPEAELHLTENTQPIMLAAGVAVWRLWQARGGCTPTLLAGHSLGEYSALVAAGALRFDAAVELVRERARLMQSAVSEGQGAMAAILGLSDEAVSEVCDRAAQGQIVAPVNFNAPGQVVIAGEAEAVARATALASEAGAKRSVRLDVSVPSHCQLMRPASEALGARLAAARVATPRIPVVHNVDAQTHEAPEGVRQALTGQVDHPVRWVDSVRYMIGEGVTTVVELGPGKVLTGLSKRIERSLTALCVQDPESLDQALALCEEAD